MVGGRIDNNLYWMTIHKQILGSLEEELINFYLLAQLPVTRPPCCCPFPSKVVAQKVKWGELTVGIFSLLVLLLLRDNMHTKSFLMDDDGDGGEFFDCSSSQPRRGGVVLPEKNIL